MNDSAYVMSWYKVLFLVGEGDDQFLNIKDSACKRMNNIGGFEILMGIEQWDDANRTCYHALYFSPTAALECEDLIASGVKCEQPDLDVDEHLAIQPAC